MLTLDELLTLLPDNSSGEISAQDLRDVTTALWAKSSIGGHVDHAGALVYGPPAWTASRSAAGVYVVTHNLGTLNYAPTITPLTKTPDQGLAPSVMETTENSFTYQVFNSDAGTLHDCDTFFTVGVVS